MAAPTPIAQGELNASPLAHVMVSLVFKGIDGTLAVWPDEQDVRGQDRIYFKNGRIRRAKILAPSGALDRSLLPLFRRKSAYAFYEADLVGEGGLEGSLDPFALVAASLRGGFDDALVDGVLARYGDANLRISGAKELGRFEWIHKEQTFIEMFRAAPQSVQEATTSAGSAKVARRVLYTLAITKHLQVFEGTYERVSLHGAPRPSAAPQAFNEEDHGLPGLSDFPAADDTAPSRPEPSARPAGSISPAAPAVSAASAARPSSAGSPRPSGAAPRPRSSSLVPPTGGLPGDPDAPVDPPDGLSDELKARWRETATFAQAIDGMNYFEMLGVQTAVSVDDVRDAYFAKVKRWHPDRLPAELAPLHAVADRIFHNLTEAQKTLSDNEERKKHLKAIQNGGGTPETDRKLGIILTAAMEFQKVDVLVRRRDYASAKSLLQEILVAVPDEADYHATLGRVLWLEQGDQSIPDVLIHIEAALRLAPENERAKMTKARILQRKGDKLGAANLFREVAKANPRNTDAIRQVRLADMRGVTGEEKRPSSRPDASKEGGGFLSKLFGGKKK